MLVCAWTQARRIVPAYRLLVRYERSTEPLERYSSQWSAADVGRPPADWASWSIKFD